MAAHILLLEDDALLRETLELDLLEAGYRVTATAAAPEALEAASRGCFDLILSDIRLPGMDGLEAVSLLRALQPMARIIMITGYASPEAPVKAVKLRVDDYLLKPFNSETLLTSVSAALERYSEKAEESPEHFREHFLHVLHCARQQPAANFAERVGRLALRLARSLHFSRQRTRRLYLTALLHNLGKPMLPTRTADSFDDAHPALGGRLLSSFPALRDVATFIVHQHERWDGQGTPRALAGEQIPLESRILAVCVGYLEKGDLKAEAGSLYDPALALRVAELTQEELSPLEPETTSRSHFLQRLAEQAKAAGNLGVVEQAYREMAEADDSELRLQAEEHLIRLWSQQGHRLQALDQLAQSLARARQQGLDLAAARLVLLQGELAEGPSDDDLVRARQTFEVWESSWEQTLCDLLLAASGSLEAYRRFLARARAESLQHELWREQFPLLWRALTSALRNSWEPQLTQSLLEGSEGLSLAFLELCFAQADVGLRLKALDLAASLSHRPVRALLARVRATQESGPVAEKSALLLHQDAENMLQVFFLGNFKVLAGERVLREGDWQTRKVLSLFAFLASRRGKAVREQQLMDLFWEHSGEKARHSLHNSISEIRKTLSKLLGSAAGKRSLEKRRDGYVFGLNIACWVDLEEFEERICRGMALAGQGLASEALAEFQGAERLYHGSAQDGLAQEWEEELAERARGRMLEMLTWVAEYFFEKNKLDVSAAYWNKVLSHDNCHEQAYLGLMQCQALSGRQSDAIRTYHQCVRQLKAELNLGPPPLLVETYLRMVGGKSI